MNRLFCLFLLLLILPMVLSVQPTQQYNKIYLSPFYHSTMTNGVNTTFNLTIHPPDGLSSTQSAIISIDVWLQPTVTFNLWVNGESCNNPTYTVSTTFAGSGRGIASFDCTNRINATGTYSVTVRPSGANTGANTAWIDLTYMNDPNGNINLHGTEYIPGDNGKMFLQFLDSNGIAVNNSECFLSVWYPNDTAFLNNSLMSKLDNANEGIYYKNFFVPNTTGVYPASAKCYKPLSFGSIILRNNVTDDFETGTFTGGTGWPACSANITCIPPYGWDVEDTVPLATVILNSSASGPCYSGLYCAKYTGGYGFIERGLRAPDGTLTTNVSFSFKFKGFQTGETMEFWVFDGNWHKLETYTQANFTNNVWYRRSIPLTSNVFNLDTVLIGFYSSATPSTNDEMFVDNVSIDFLSPNITISNVTEYQVLHGSGEVHVSKLYDSLIEQIFNFTANATNNTDTLSLLRIINSTTKDIQSNITPILGNLTHIDNDLHAINNTLVSNFQSINQSIINITTGIAQLQSTANSISQNLTIINQSLHNRLTEINQSLDQHLTSINQSMSAYLITIISDIADVQTTVDQIQDDTTDLLSDTAQIQNTLNNMSVTLNATYQNTNTIITMIQNINTSLSQFTQNLTTIIDGVNLANANIYSLAITLNNMALNDTLHDLFLQEVNVNVTQILYTVQGLQFNLSQQNLSSINQSLTALIIEENARPRTFDFNTVLIILLALLLITSIFYNAPGFLFIVAFYSIVYGLILVTTTGFWVGFLIIGVGVSYAIIGWRKMQ